MSTCSCFFTSSIGRKVMMAASGVLLLGFVIAHLIGNLQVFAGQEVFNAYAAFLKDLGPLLWVARIGLLAVLVLHVATAISLWRDNANARPERYREEKTIQASAASLYMMQSGMVIFIFIVIHLLHFTIGVLQPEYFILEDAQQRHDVFSMLVYGFLNKGYVAVYLVAMALLGLHLSHAIASMFQTIGINGPRITPAIRSIGSTVAWLIVLGYISIPLAVQFGLVRLPNGGSL